jgi:hypothetical protein
MDGSLPAGPLNAMIEVKIAADGVPAEKLREIVDSADHYSPVHRRGQAGSCHHGGGRRRLSNRRGAHRYGLKGGLEGLILVADSATPYVFEAVIRRAPVPAWSARHDRPPRTGARNGLTESPLGGSVFLERPTPQ